MRKGATEEERPAEWKRAREAETLLQGLLVREAELDVSGWQAILQNDLRAVAIEFRAGSPDRLKNLARDLAACWTLYEGLRKEIGRISGVMSEWQAIKDLIEFSISLRQSVRALERVNAHLETLPGLMSLEFALGALKGFPTELTGEQRGIKALSEIILETVERAKIDLVLGTRPSNLFADISDDISNYLEKMEIEEGPTPERVPVTGFAGMCYGHIVAARGFVDFDHSDQSKRFVDSAVDFLKTAATRRKSKGRGLTLASIPAFSFAWAICNLIDGWKPCSGKRPVKVSGNANGYFVKLLGTIASQSLAAPLDGNPFSSAAARVAVMYKARGPTWGSVFAGRNELQTEWRRWDENDEWVARNSNFPDIEPDYSPENPEPYN